MIETRSGTTKGHSRFALRLLRGVFHVYAQVRGWRDTRRLRRRFPALCDPRRLAAASARLEPTYRKYVTTVSSADMAISLDLAAFLSVMCEFVQPERILDLGSGFSSVTFRRYASTATRKPTVVSVDDSPDWLDRTRAFLADCGLSTQNLWSWSEFVRQDPRAFDFILHDLGTIALRAETLERVLSLMNAGCPLILDDAHKANYHRYARKLLRRQGFEYAMLRPFTLDRFGRFAILVLPRTGGFPALQPVARR